MSENLEKLSNLSEISTELIGDIRQMIEETRSAVAVTVSARLTMLYWRIGSRINQEVLKGKRGDYGKQILATLSQELTQEYGSSFAEKNLRRMVQFAEVFPDERIVVSLIRQLSWTHIIALIPLKQPLQREFYAEMCRVERWSVRTLPDDFLTYHQRTLSQYRGIRGPVIETDKYSSAEYCVRDLTNSFSVKTAA